MERNTRQREYILETFHAADGPLSPQEVLVQTQKNLPQIGIATVYRNIKAFVDSGTVRIVPIPGEPDRYEVAGKKHHHHFVCRVCKKAFELEGCPGSLSSLAPRGFKVESHEIFLYGVCRKCRWKKK
jgi:Fur family ferric uptake transcriptional regulator